MPAIKCKSAKRTTPPKAQARASGGNESNSQKPAAPPAEWLTTTEVSRLLGRSRKTVLKLAEEGHLPVNRPGRTRPLYSRAAVEALARQAGLLA